MAIYQGSASRDSVNGTGGSDTLYGYAGDDTLGGAGGNDVVDGGAGVDTATFRGLFADYSITWNSSTHQYRVVDRTGRDGTDLVAGVEYFRFTDGTRSIAQLVPGTGDGWTLTGTSAGEQLAGNVGYDTLLGQAGNDTLGGGAANDTIDGGAGTDTALYAGTFGEYRVTWDASMRAYTVTDLRAGRDGTDLVHGVEYFSFADGLRAITDLVPGVGDGELASGTAGNDLLAGNVGYDTLQGLDGNDTLQGFAADDVLAGGAGDDRLAGGGGNDSLDGGSGSADMAVYEGQRADYDISWDAAAREYTVRDRVGLRDGVDVVRGVEFFQFADGSRDIGQLLAGQGDGVVLSGADGDDLLAGGVGYDQLQGLAGRDSLVGGRANDSLDGGAGDDFLQGDAGDDVLVGGDGIDRAHFGGWHADYDITWNAATREYTVADRMAGRDGTDVVRGVEFFEFVDGVRSIADLVPGMGDGETLVGTAGDDQLVGGMGYDLVQGLEGNDFLGGLSANDTLEGGAGDDYLRGDEGDDRIDGGMGMDRVHFSGWFSDYDISWNAATREYTFVDRMAGRDGTDVVDGVEVFEFADGARNWSSLVPGTGDGEVLVGTAGDDQLVGGMGYDLVQGLEGNDFLGGLSANDTLEGGAGDDYLRGDEGDDRIDGGTGMDRVHFSGWFSDYDISWNAATREYTVIDRMAGRDGTDVVRGVEVFEFADGARDWSKLVPGTGDGVVLVGTAGDDQLVGGMGYDLVQGLEGNDFLGGLSANDTLEGGAGDDYLRGDEGDDRIDGGTGMDRVHFSGWFSDYDITWNASAGEYTIADRMPGRDGVDAVRGAELFEFMDGMRTAADLVPGVGAGDTLVGTAGDDTLVGGPGYDLVQGLDGNDFLGGLEANDTLEGGAGDDYLRGDKGDDRIDGGAGMDRVHFDGWFSDYDITWNASAGEYTIADRMAGRDGVDAVRGAELFEFMDGMRTAADLVPGVGAGDTLVGTAGDDTLLGGAGYDVLQGLDGKDKLAGGAADDTLEGGAGDDDLRGEAGDDRIDGGAGTDVLHLGGWYADYDITWNAATREYTIADRMGGRDGTDFVRGVELFDFMDAQRTTGDLVPGVGDGDVLVGTAGDDWLFGGPGYDLVQGLEGKDFLVGGAANDTLEGGAGDDDLRGEAGDDLLAGGDGIDVARYQGWSSDYVVTPYTALGDLSIADRMPGRDGTDRVSGVELFAFQDGVWSVQDLINLQLAGVVAPTDPALA